MAKGPASGGPDDATGQVRKNQAQDGFKRKFTEQGSFSSLLRRALLVQKRGNGIKIVESGSEIAFVVIVMVLM